MSDGREQTSKVFKIGGVTFGVLSFLTGVLSAQGFVGKLLAALVALLVTSFFFFFGYVLDLLSEIKQEGRKQHQELQRQTKWLETVSRSLTQLTPAPPSKSIEPIPTAMFQCPRCGNHAEMAISSSAARNCPSCRVTSPSSEWQESPAGVTPSGHTHEEPVESSSAVQCPNCQEWLPCGTFGSETSRACTQCGVQSRAEDWLEEPYEPWVCPQCKELVPLNASKRLPTEMYWYCPACDRGTAAKSWLAVNK